MYIAAGAQWDAGCYMCTYPVITVKYCFKSRADGLVPQAHGLGTEGPMHSIKGKLLRSPSW